MDKRHEQAKRAKALAVRRVRDALEHSLFMSTIPGRPMPCERSGAHVEALADELVRLSRLEPPVTLADVEETRTER